MDDAELGIKGHLRREIGVPEGCDSICEGSADSEPAMQEQLRLYRTQETEWLEARVKGLSEALNIEYGQAISSQPAPRQSQQVQPTAASGMLSLDMELPAQGVSERARRLHIMQMYNSLCQQVFNIKNIAMQVGRT
jgi:hypothetical protein